jgi:hypothetical protein
MPQAIKAYRAIIYKTYETPRDGRVVRTEKYFTRETAYARVDYLTNYLRSKAHNKTLVAFELELL